MAFISKPVEEVPSFGEKLRRIREEAGLTKEKVGQLLGVQIRYLDKLENGEIEKLPADVYVKGFLKKYAKVLGIDAESLTNEYEKESRILRHLSRGSHPSLPTLKRQRFIITSKTISLALIALLVFLVAGYLIYQLHFLIGPPGLKIFEPAADFSTNQSMFKISGWTEPGDKLTINGQSAYINEEGNFEQEITLNQGLNIIHVEAVNRFKKTSSITRRIILEPAQ